MKSGSVAYFKFAVLCLLLNTFFWLIFGVLFVAESYPYKPHKLLFEEATPSYIFFGRALREIDSGTGASLPPPLINVTRAIQKPSFVTAKPYFWYFDSHEITVDHLYWGVSVGGYYLVLVCLLSFLQWYFVGFFIDYVRRRLTGKPSRPIGSDHAYDAPA